MLALSLALSFGLWPAHLHTSPPPARHAKTAVRLCGTRGQLSERVPQPEPPPPPPPPRQLAGDEYADALADARRAAARLREAEERLARVPAPVPPMPRGARATVSRSDAGTLLVDVPAAGLVNGGSLFGGAFAAAWFSAVVPATVSMVASGGASALFMLPFWLAGGAVVKQTVLDPAKATTLSIGAFGWELKQRTAGVSLKSADGPTEQLALASVDVAAYVNGVPTFVLNLVANGPGGQRVYQLGSGLSEQELEWIAAEVNATLEEVESNPPEPLL
eukprot:CAMPEP_0185407470 /NCGR_PEP_ID=MMETSP1365-20130426/1329_1 /TAXON_ID=38817 /ORGANISM="Gephyrocapsa oceanica, Strain RCC1303" /LENGTH=275 /DNA_ID=CAMNT_0028009897 /DNA_START=98 /DNA_END=925 /DNA_ORIENTATION=+